MTVHHSEYELRLLVDQDAIVETRKQHANSWRKGLSVQQYLTRERLLRLSPLTHNVRVYGLVKRGTSKILCSLELLVLTGLKWVKNGEQALEFPEPCACVSAVYTPSSNRGKGFAGIMMGKLKEKATAEDFGFLFLYSEIGDYYSRFGFELHHVPVVKIPLVQKHNTFKLPSGASLVEFDSFAELLSICRAQENVQISQKVISDGLPRLVTPASISNLNWFHLRAKHAAVCKFSTKPDLSAFEGLFDELVEEVRPVQPSHFGIRLDNPDTGNLDGLIVWNVDYGHGDEGNQVSVLKLHVNLKCNQAQVALQLCELMIEYFQADQGIEELRGFRQIVIWENKLQTCTITALKEAGASVGVENLAVSAICMSAENLNDGAIWENNTKLSWF